MRKLAVAVVLCSSIAFADPAANYRAQMAAGHAAVSAKQWAQAVTAYKAALVAKPHDVSALGELGLAAAAAGDSDTAIAADSDGVRVATTPELAAMALYNLGGAYELVPDDVLARLAYRASLALRANKTVADAATHAGVTATPICAGVSAAALCACLATDSAHESIYPYGPSDDATKACTPGDAIDTLATTAIAMPNGTFHYLLDPSRQVVLAYLGVDGIPMPWTEVWSLKSHDIRTIGGHRVLVIVSDQEQLMHNHTDSASAETTTETICLLDGKVTCPVVALPIAVVGMSTHTTGGKEIVDPKTGFSLAAKIADDGTLTLGGKRAAFKLW